MNLHEQRLVVEDRIVLSAVSLKKCYMRGSEEIRAVDGVTFDIHSGEFVAIVGQSGSGKTTLLQLMGAMDTPTSGSIEIESKNLAGLPDRALTQLRREYIGFVFQQFGLLPTLTVAENVGLPFTGTGKQRSARVAELLVRVGLAHRGRHRPSELSGGEMQRVAVARALVNSPKLLLADEPTGNLDSVTGSEILGLLQSLRTDGLTVVVVTHNDMLAEAADRIIRLHDGKIVQS